MGNTSNNHDLDKKDKVLDVKVFLCVSLFRSLKPHSSILTVWHFLMHPARNEQKISYFSYLLILVSRQQSASLLEIAIGAIDTFEGY